MFLTTKSTTVLKIETFLYSDVLKFDFFLKIVLLNLERWGLDDWKMLGFSFTFNVR